MKQYDLKFWLGVLFCAGIGAAMGQSSGLIIQTVMVLIGGAIGFWISRPKGS